MTQPQETALNVLKSPLAQAVGTGALVLIPARKYPAWLRQTLTWGSTAAAVGLTALPKSRTPSREPSTRESENEQDHRPAKAMSPAVRVGAAAGAGAVVYGSWRFTWWFDDAAEKALRKLRVPFPRAVMGAACGVWFYRMEAGAREQITAPKVQPSGDVRHTQPG